MHEALPRSRSPVGVRPGLTALTFILLICATFCPAVADTACEIRLFGKIYEVHYIPPSSGVYPRMNAISEAVTYDLGPFGTEVASTVVGVLGSSVAGTFNQFNGQSPLRPPNDPGNASSEAEDISADGRYVIGWRKERPGSAEPPPKAFLFSNESGFQYLEDLYPSLRALAEEVYPPVTGRVYGSKGMRINNRGQMLIETSPGGGSPQGYYILQPGGLLTPVHVQSGLDLNESGQLPAQGMNAINDRGRSTDGSDINNFGVIGRPPGNLEGAAGNIDLRALIRAQCDDPRIQKELAGPVGLGVPVYVNDANAISMGHLLITPACPDLEFRTQGISGFEFLNGKVTVRVGNRFTVRTTLDNFGRGTVENLRIQQAVTFPYFRQIGITWPPAPDRLGPGERWESISEWEVLTPGQYVGNPTLTATGTCGPIALQTPESRITVISDRDARVDIDLPKQKFDVNEEFVATVMVTSYIEDSLTVTLRSPIIEEGAAQLLDIGATEDIEPFVLTRDAPSRRFAVAMKALKPGVTDLSSLISFTTSAGPVKHDRDEQAITVDPLQLTLTVTPKMFALNQLSTNRQSQTCIELAAGSPGSNNNCVEILLVIKNHSDQPVTDISVPGAEDILTLISSNDPENPGVPLTPLRFVPPAGTADKPEAFTLEPDQSAAYVWNLNAFHAPADLKVRARVVGGIGTTPIQSIAQTNLTLVDKPLLKWGVRPQDGRTHYESGQPVRVEGYVENVSKATGEGRDLVALVYQLHEGNLGGGFMGPGGTTADRYFMFTLPPEGPQRRVSTHAIFRSFPTDVASKGLARYGVRLWVYEDDGSLTLASDQALLDEDWLDEFEVQFAAQPAPPDTYRDDCRQSGLPAWLCGMSQGIYFEFAEGMYGLYQFASKSKDEFQNMGAMLLAHNVWLNRTLWKAVKGDPAARNALLQEAYVEYLTLVNLGVMAGEGGSKFPMAFEAFSIHAVGAVDNFFRAVDEGNLEEVQFQVGKFFGANPDLLLEPLVVSRTYQTMMKSMRSTATDLTDNVVATAERQEAARQRATLDQRVAAAEADPNVTDLGTILRAGDELDDNLLARIYGISSEQREALQKFCQKYQVIATFRSRHPRALQFLKDNLAWPKPQGLKWKTVSDIDVEFLGYRSEALAKLELVEPPRDLIGKKGREFEAALDQYMVGLRAKHPKLRENGVLSGEVRQRLKVRIEEWEKLGPSHELGPNVSTIDIGVSFDEGAQFVNRKGVKQGITESRKVTHTPVEGVIDPVTGARRRTWELTMEGPGGAPARPVVGDVDFLGLLEPDGGLIRDPKKRLQIYEELSLLLDMQHGESYTFFLQKTRVEHLRCCTEGGEAMVTISPFGESTPTAGYFVDNLSVFDDGPNTAFLGRRKKLTNNSGEIVYKNGEAIDLRREDPTGEFVLINGMQTADSIRQGFLARFIPKTYEQIIAGFLRRLPFYFPTYIQRLIDASEPEETPASARVSRMNTATRPLSFHVTGPIVQPGAKSAADPSGNHSLQIWTPNRGWTPATVAEVIAHGQPGLPDLAPITSLAAGASPGDTRIVLTPQVELEVPGRFFQSGDLVVLNPGGFSQEFAVLASLNPVTLSSPLVFGHETSETVAFVEAGATDSDGDGLSDRQEQDRSTDPSRPDSDGDGFTDGAEVAAGSDPADRDSHLRILSAEPAPEAGAGLMRLTWTSAPGRLYLLEVAFDMDGTQWNAVGVVEGPAVGTTASALDEPPASDLTRFYRVRLVP